MGDDRGATNEQPAHKLELFDFRIAKYPVTNAQYAAFVAATGQEAPRFWQGNRPPAELMNHPVVYVTWHVAVAFCVWLSDELDEKIRLPSEAEWEKATKGDQDNRRYPWGDNEPDENRCNFAMNVGTTTTVGMYPMGISPYQCHDMSGNVWEWTSSLCGEKNPMDPEFGYPYDAGDGLGGFICSGSSVQSAVLALAGCSTVF